jgi:DNA-binding IclR family transcriptional regulator
MQEVERLREALVKVKDRCWEADEANWQHDILSIVVPITDALHTPEPTP